MRGTGTEYPRSSDEGPVMGRERRGVPHPAFRLETTGSPGGSLGGEHVGCFDLRPDETSRMS